MREQRLHPVPRLILGALLVAVAGGCASKRDIRDLQMELRALNARQDSLLMQLRRDAARQARSTRDTLRTQADQLVELRGEIMLQLREINQTLATLQAIAGENQRAIAAIRDQLLTGGGPRTQVSDTAPVVAGGAQQTQEAEAVYNAAVQQLNRGQIGTARRAFESFLQRYPNDELAPQAHFFLADILVRENRLDQALEAFRRIPTLFPTSDAVPQALYRIALIQIERDELDQARATLERVLNTYPDAGVAILAREKLDEIR